jgi:hypothetical protein
VGNKLSSVDEPYVRLGRRAKHAAAFMGP